MDTTSLGKMLFMFANFRSNPAGHPTVLTGAERGKNWTADDGMLTLFEKHLCGRILPISQPCGHASIRQHSLCKAM